MNKKRQRQEIGGDNGFEEWGGYMSAKKNKLLGQFQDQAKKERNSETKIFNGVAIFVNGYTVPSADDLKRIMMVHGGTYHHYFSTERTTHIIASNLPDVKIKQLKSLHVRVVKPEWITACLDSGRQVDFRPFLLYSHQSTTQQSIVKFGFESSSDSNDVGGSVLSQNCDTVSHVNNEDQDLFDDEDEQVPLVTDQKDDDRGSVHTAADAPDISKASSEARCATDEDVPDTSNAFSKTRCATEPNFLSDFYDNSRLHHISTMGAMFKQYINELRQKNSGNFPGRVRLKDWKHSQHSSQSCQAKFLRGDDEDIFGPETLPSNSIDSRTVIMHIDMDCFFVSVGLRKYPHLRGKPVAVTHSKGTGPQVPQCEKGADRQFEFRFYKKKLEEKSFKDSKAGVACKELNPNSVSRHEWMDNIDDLDSLAEIASCSYEARSKGVKNGMFMGSALKLCPNLKAIPYDFEGYKEVAHILYSTVASYTLDIEAVSCDEMFVDCTTILEETKCSPLELAACLREEVKEKTQCPASTGFGGNRLLSRLATRKAKPDGMFYLEPSSEENFMKTVKVNDLPGVGYSLASRLEAMGVVTCGDLQKLPLDKLRKLGNKTGEALYEHCRGRDNRPLNFAHQRKSVSAEVNYGIRFKNSIDAETFLHQLTTEVHVRLKEVNMKGRCISLKLMVRAENAPVETAKFMGHGVCDNLTRSSTLPNAVSDFDSIFREVMSIFKKLDKNPCDLRGIGIQLSRLESISNSKASCSTMEKFLLKEPDEYNSSEQKSLNKGSVQEKIRNSVSSNANTASRLLPKPKGPKCTSTIDNFMVSRKKSTRRDVVSKLPAPSDLDLAVFSALPEDIRNEILQEYSLNRETCSAKSSNGPAQEDISSATSIIKEPCEKLNHQSLEVTLSQVDSTFLDALPSQVRHELEMDLHNRRELRKNTKFTAKAEKEKEKNSKLFGSCGREESFLSSVLSVREVRDMIHTWVLEERQPLPSDVHILKHYFQDLVSKKSIDDLYTIIRGFYRCVLKRPELAWVKEYENIILSVQTAMQEVYHTRLQVEDSIAVPSCSK